MQPREAGRVWVVPEGQEDRIARQVDPSPSPMKPSRKEEEDGNKREDGGH